MMMLRKPNVLIPFCHLYSLMALSLLLLVKLSLNSFTDIDFTYDDVS